MPYDLILVNCVHRNNDGTIQQSGQLGLLYIAGVAKAAGYEVRILAGDELAAELLEVTRSSPRPLVGFYVNSDNQQEVLRLASYVKARCPSSRMILGGPVSNVLDMELVQQDGIDFVGRGDGEYLVREVLQHLHTGVPALPSILGLTFRSPEGRPVRNPSRPLIQDLDELPIPDRTLYPSTQAGVKSQLLTARGCGFKCTFCFESTNRKYRAHSPERIIEEMKQLQRDFGTTYFAFVDDIFTQNPRRLRELCRLMHKHFRPHENLFWYCEARVDALARYPDLLPMMREAGLVRIQIGTESGSQAVIDAYKKEITLDEIRVAVEQCNRAKLLSIFTNFIVGGALEDESTFEATLEFAKELLRLAPGRFECNTSFLSPYPGTDIASNPDKYRIRFLDPTFETGLSDDYIFAETFDLDKNRLLQMERTFKKEVYKTMLSILPDLDPEVILEHLRLNDHGLQTQWSDYIRNDEILLGCGRFMQAGYIRKIPAGVDASQIIPSRTFSVRRCADGPLEWKLRRTVVELEPYERFILELASGKLTLSDIADRAFVYWKGEVSKDELARDIKSFYKGLAARMLVVFRVFGEQRARPARRAARAPRASSAGDAGLGLSAAVLPQTFSQASRRGVRLRVVD